LRLQRKNIEGDYSLEEDGKYRIKGLTVRCPIKFDVVFTKSMTKEEKVAREVCAWCNFVAKCEDCPHREWPSGKWHKKPRWNHKKCNEWRYYLKSRRRKLIEKIRKAFKLHKWHTECTILVQPFIRRTCTICDEKQEFKNNKWIKVDLDGN